MEASLKRYFDPWNLVGLALLPAAYWSLDLLWHAAFSESQFLLLANLIIPVAISSAALLCWRLWGAHLASCVSLGFCVWLGIYISGPAYMLLQVKFLPANSPQTFHELLSGWAITTLLFPISTWSISTYDATLPAPFLTWLGVWTAGKVHARFCRPAAAVTN